MTGSQCSIEINVTSKVNFGSSFTFRGSAKMMICETKGEML